MKLTNHLGLLDLLSQELSRLLKISHNELHVGQVFHGPVVTCLGYLAGLDRALQDVCSLLQVTAPPRRMMVVICEGVGHVMRDVSNISVVGQVSSFKSQFLIYWASCLII